MTVLCLTVLIDVSHVTTLVRSGAEPSHQGMID